MRHYTPTGWIEEPLDSIKGWGTEEDYTEVLQQLDTSPRDFLTAVVYSLTWKLDDAAANITGIYCDQWCGISGSGAPFESYGLLAMTGDKGKIGTWFECDKPEWGIAATWKAFVEEFGLRVKE